MRRPVLAAAALVALAVVLAALPIGSDVYEGGEAREGLVVREMLRTGDWILPLWNGSVVPSKPPLFHWLAAGAAALTGAGVTERTLRAPSIVLAGLVVLLVFLAGRAWGGEQVGFMAALVLATTPQFLNEAGDGRVDMTLTTAITGAQLAFVHALRGGGGPTRLVLALCLALAMLAKGPVGPGLVGLTALVSALANWRLGPALRLVRPLPVLVFFSLAPLKRAAYLLPLRPALALMIGWWLAETAEEERPAGGWVAVARGLAVVSVAGLLALAAAAGAIRWGLVPGARLIEQGARHEIDAATYLRVVAAAWAAIGALGLTGALAAGLAARALGRAQIGRASCRD